MTNDSIEWLYFISLLAKQNFGKLIISFKILGPHMQSFFAVSKLKVLQIRQGEVFLQESFETATKSFPKLKIETVK